MAIDKLLLIGSKMHQLILDIQWKKFLLGEEDWSFLPEAIFRTVIMFLVILISLRLLGKRGVKQLSVFELGVIIGLGSAAGDPMFYKEVGLLTGLTVFLVVMSLYRLVTILINRSESFEKFVEGKPTVIIRRGKLLLYRFEREPIATDELFSELRLGNISHLGQVREAIIEPNGRISIYYMPNDEVRHGLPIMPEEYEKQQVNIEKEDIYSCAKCGNTDRLKPAKKINCDNCKSDRWLKSANEKRIT